MWNTHENAPAINPLEGFDSAGEAWEYLSCFADRADTEPAAFDAYGREISFGLLRRAVRELEQKELLDLHDEEKRQS